jgi:hypothetical protein
VDVYKKINLREGKCVLVLVIVLEVFMLIFALTMFDILAAFGTIDPDFMYYVFKLVVTAGCWLILIGRFFRLTHFKEMLIAKELEREGIAEFKWYERLCFRHISQKRSIIIFLFGFFVICAVYCITLTKFTTGLCIAYHNDFGMVLKDLSMTTALSRSYLGNKCLSTGKPCFVYLTLAEDATDVFINFHVNSRDWSSNKDQIPVVHFRKQGTEAWEQEPSVKGIYSSPTTEY